MKYVALSDAKAKLSELVDRVRTLHEAIVIRKRDKDAVVLVEAELFRRLQALEDQVTRMQLQKALKGRKHDLREVLSELKLEV